MTQGPEKIDFLTLVQRYQSGQRSFTNVCLDGVVLRGAELPGSDFSRCTFREAELTSIRFDGCKMQGCDFTGAKLNSCVFRENAELEEALFCNAKLMSTSFTRSHLAKARFERSLIQGCDFSQAVAEGADFSETTIERSEFGATRLVGARFERSAIVDTRFRGAQLTATDLRSVSLVRSVFAQSKLDGARVDGSKFHSCEFDGASTKSLELRDVDLSGSTFVDNDLRTSDLRAARIGGVKFRATDLRGCDLRGIEVDDKTSFSMCKVTDSLIERQTLDGLAHEGGQWGGLTMGQLRSMKIIDGIKELRSNYSGFWQWLHLTALTVFLFPYVVFALKLYIQVDPTCATSECTAVHSRLWQFIKTGGTLGETIAWGPFLVFWFSLSYNVLRFVLLAKTKSLELAAASAGFAPKFSLDDRVAQQPVMRSISWGQLLRAAKIGFFVNVLLVLYHFWHFLQLPTRAQT